MVLIRMKVKVLGLSEFSNTRKKNCGIVVIGGANIDFKGRPYEKLMERTSNPGEVNISFGGVGRNIAHNLALLCVPVTFLSAIGDDEWGKKLLEETGKDRGEGKAGVQVNDVIKLSNVQTGIYLAILNEKGQISPISLSVGLALAPIQTLVLSQGKPALVVASFYRGARTTH